MGKKNSSLDNVHGSGKQQIFTNNSGKQYRIKNSSLDNVYGKGKQKIVEEVGNEHDTSLLDLLFPSWFLDLLGAIIGIVAIGLVVWSVIR